MDLRTYSFPLVLLTAASAMAQSTTPPTGKPEDGLVQIAPNRLQVTKPISTRIGKPARPYPEEALKALREIARGAGAREVYAFAIQFPGGPVHLGIGVLPDDQKVFARIGSQFEPIWRQWSPSNTVFDILPIKPFPQSDPIRTEGVLVYSSNAKR